MSATYEQPRSKKPAACAAKAKAEAKVEALDAKAPAAEVPTAEGHPLQPPKRPVKTPPAPSAPQRPARDSKMMARALIVATTGSADRVQSARHDASALAELERHEVVPEGLPKQGFEYVNNRTRESTGYIGHLMAGSTSTDCDVDLAQVPLDSKLQSLEFTFLDPAPSGAHSTAELHGKLQCWLDARFDAAARATASNGSCGTCIDSVSVGRLLSDKHPANRFASTELPKESDGARHLEYGLFANESIARLTVIGEYEGLRLRATPRAQERWHRQASFAAWERQAYICCHDDRKYETDTEGPNLRATLIDGYDYRNKLAFLNDPREYKDIMAGSGRSSPRVEGGSPPHGLPKRSANVCASWVKVRGRKHLLIWSIKPIAKGRELLLAYGPAYWSAHKQYCQIKKGSLVLDKSRKLSTQRTQRQAGEAADSDASWDNVCFDCGQGGDLLCCESGAGCKASFHVSCAGLVDDPSDGWKCPLCSDPVTELEAAMPAAGMVNTALRCIVEAVLAVCKKPTASQEALAQDVSSPEQLAMAYLDERRQYDAEQIQAQHQRRLLQRSTATVATPTAMPARSRVPAPPAPQNGQGRRSDALEQIATASKKKRKSPPLGTDRLKGAQNEVAGRDARSSSNIAGRYQCSGRAQAFNGAVYQVDGELSLHPDGRVTGDTDGQITEGRWELDKAVERCTLTYSLSYQDTDIRYSYRLKIKLEADRAHMQAKGRWRNQSMKERNNAVENGQLTLHLRLVKRLEAARQNSAAKSRQVPKLPGHSVANGRKIFAGQKHSPGLAKHLSAVASRTEPVLVASHTEEKLSKPEDWVKKLQDADLSRRRPPTNASCTVPEDHRDDSNHMAKLLPPGMAAAVAAVASVRAEEEAMAAAEKAVRDERVREAARARKRMRLSAGGQLQGMQQRSVSTTSGPGRGGPGELRAHNHRVSQLVTQSGARSSVHHGVHITASRVHGLQPKRVPTRAPEVYDLVSTSDDESSDPSDGDSGSDSDSSSSASNSFRRAGQSLGPKETGLFDGCAMGHAGRSGVRGGEAGGSALWRPVPTKLRPPGYFPAVGSPTPMKPASQPATVAHTVAHKAHISTYVDRVDDSGRARLYPAAAGRTHSPLGASLWSQPAQLSVAAAVERERRLLAAQLLSKQRQQEGIYHDSGPKRRRQKRHGFGFGLASSGTAQTAAGVFDGTRPSAAQPPADAFARARASQLARMERVETI